MKSFTDLFLEYSQDAESPESFFRWASYAGIAAVMRDNVWVNLHLKKVWPNIYVLLFAKSAALRKGTPLQLTKGLVAKIGNTRIIAGRTSMQAVIRDLSETETDKVTGKITKGAAALLLTEELSSFSPEDPATIPLLTDLYDNHETWDSNLKSEGKRRLENTCITLLAATNETLFRTVYTGLAIRGGLLGRTFVIKEQHRRCADSLMYVDGSKYNKDALLQSLSDISHIKGEVQISDEARKEYDTWYRTLDYSLVTDDTGVLERIHWGVLKIALILAISSTYAPKIEKIHVEEAIVRCMGILKNYEALTMSSGKSIVAEPGAVLLAFLWEKGGKATHKETLRVNWRHFDGDSLKIITSTLSQAGLILERAEGGEVIYSLTCEGKKIFEGRGKK